jgi:hypothetical protein
MDILLSLCHCGGCAEEIRELLDSPTVSLLGSPVSRASAEMVTEGVKDELATSAGRGRHSRDDRDRRTNSSCKERLPVTATKPYHPIHRRGPHSPQLEETVIGHPGFWHMSAYAVQRPSTPELEECRGGQRQL